MRSRFFSAALSPLFSLSSPSPTKPWALLAAAGLSRARNNSNLKTLAALATGSGPSIGLAIRFLQDIVGSCILPSVIEESQFTLREPLYLVHWLLFYLNDAKPSW